MEMKRGKKAALELSLTTIITIVLAVVFLILALIVMRNMYGFQSESVKSIQDKTLSQINKLYLGDEDAGKSIYISLGSEKTANIRAGNTAFGIEVGAGTITGARIQSEDQLQFKLMLDETSPTNCIKMLGGKSQVIALFKTKLDTWLNMTQFDGAAGGMIIFVGVPKATPVCEQIVKVQARDRTVNPEGDIIAQDFFTIKILKKSPFG
jgi:hypothetical protein